MSGLYLHNTDARHGKYAPMAQNRPFDKNYGHRVEDWLCWSPSTADIFTGDRWTVGKPFDRESFYCTLDHSSVVIDVPVMLWYQF